VLERLSNLAARRPGTSVSAIAARYVNEGLQMDEHPGIVFRDGPTGRRAVLIGGPDVWEVVRHVRATRRRNPRLTDDAVLDLVVENSGLTRLMIDTALAYRAAYPAEVDAHVADADRAETEGLQALERTRELMSE
jgi:hypothetical protein